MILLALLFIVLGLAIALWQRRAVTCSRHSRWAGRLAWVLSGLCVLGGAALLAVAWMP
jgi:hypothetical protein